MLLSRSASLAITLSTSFVLGCGGSSGGSKGGGAAGSRAATMNANLTGVAAIGNKSGTTSLTDDGSTSKVVALDSAGKILAQSLVTADDGSGDPLVLSEATVLRDGSIVFGASFYRKIAVAIEKDVVVTLSNGKALWTDCRTKLRIFPAKNNAIDCLINTTEDTTFAYDFDVTKILSDKLGNVFYANGSIIKRYAVDGTSFTLLDQAYESRNEDVKVTEDGVVYLRTERLLISPTGTKKTVSGEFIAAVGSKVIMADQGDLKLYDTDLNESSIDCTGQCVVDYSLDAKVVGDKISFISINDSMITIDLTAQTARPETIHASDMMNAAIFAGQGFLFANNDGMFYRQTAQLSLTDAGAGNLAVLEGVAIRSMTKVGDRVIFSGSENGVNITGAVDMTTMEVQKATSDLPFTVQAL